MIWHLFNYQTQWDLLLVVGLAIYIILLFTIGQIMSHFRKDTYYKVLAHLLACMATFIMLGAQTKMDIIFYLHPKNMLTLFYPAILFNIMYELDLVIFRKHLFKIITFAIIMSTSFSCVLGLSMILLTGVHCKLLTILFYGFSMGSIDYLDSNISVLSLGSMKNTFVLLQVESIIGADFCYVVLNFALLFYNGAFTDWYLILLYFVRQFFGGLALGICAGRLLYSVIEIFLDSTLHIAMFMILSPISLYYIGQYYLGVSGGIAVQVYAYSFARYKTRIPTTISKDLEKLNVSISRIAQALMFFFAVVPFFVRTLQFFDSQLLMEYLALYIMAMCFRFLLLLIILPMMRYVQHTQDIGTVFMMSWFAKRSAIQMIHFLHVLSDPTAHALVSIATPHMFFFSTITMLVVNVDVTALFSRNFRFRRGESNSINNLMISIKKIETIQQYFMSMVRMNAVYADVNWKHVTRSLKITFPDDPDNRMNEYKTRQSFCSDCKKVIIFEPTKKELRQLTIEAKQALIKAHKISFITQYERGQIQKHVVTILLAFVELASNSKELMLDPTLFRSFIHKETLFLKTRTLIRNLDPIPQLLRPRKWYRCVCFKMVMHYSYETLFVIVNLTDFVVWLWDIIDSDSLDMLTLIVVKAVIFFIYLLDCFLKILAYSHIYIKEGMHIYFSNMWDQFDFVVIITLFIEVTFNLIDFNTPVSMYNPIINNSIRALLTIHIFRIFKLMLVVKRHEPVILKFLDKMIGLRIMLAVDIGLALIKSYDEVLYSMPNLVDNEVICEELTEKAKEGKIMVKSELINRTAGRDWVTITSKTRIAIRNCFFVMRSKIDEMYGQGQIDEFEYDKLQHTYETSQQNFFNIKIITIPDDEELIYQLGFMVDEAVSFYCFVNSFKAVYESGQIILPSGSSMEGIMIMKSGLVRIEYRPPDTDLYSKVGALPGIDEVEEDTLFIERNYYLMSGNTIGEMGLLTGRNYQCDIIAEERSELIVLPTHIINNCMDWPTDSVTTGLHSLMWTYFTLNIINSIMWKTKLFIGHTKDEVSKYTIRGFFLDLSRCHVFRKSKYVEDMVLIEGTIRDTVTMDQYVAPCYIPRNVQKIRLLPNPEYKVIPKLYMIPVDVSLIPAIVEDTKKSCVMIDEKSNAKRPVKRISYSILKKHGNIGILKTHSKSRLSTMSNMDQSAPASYDVRSSSQVHDIGNSSPTIRTSKVLTRTSDNYFVIDEQSSRRRLTPPPPESTATVSSTPHPHRRSSTSKTGKRLSLGKKKKR